MDTNLKDDIQNSEYLLDLSNRMLNSYIERDKIINKLSVEERSFRNIINSQQKIALDITANIEKYMKYQITSKELEKKILDIEENRNKIGSIFKNIQGKVKEQYKESLKSNSELIEKIEKENKLNQEATIQLDLSRSILQEILKKKERGQNVSETTLNITKSNLRNAQEEVKNSDILLKNLQKEQQEQENIVKTSSSILTNGKEILGISDKEIKRLKEQLEIRKKIEDSTGLLGALAKSVSKIPGIGRYLKTDDAIDGMEKLAIENLKAGKNIDNFGVRSNIALKGANILVGELIQKLKSPEFAITVLLSAVSVFVKSALKANNQSVELGKNLGYGADNADRIQANFRNIERTSRNINVNTTNLNEAFNQISESTGFVTEYSKDALETQIKLTKQLGLSGKEAAGIYESSVLTGKSSEATYQSMLKGYVATRNSLKVGVPFKAAMADAAKVTGQLAANMGYNVENIVKGVISTKALGTSLEQAKSQGESLLNFQSSIENELEAELITGRKLNLERARASALMGDQVTVAEELANQGITAAEFSKMNVIAQNSYAKALGTTSDELANQLKKRELAIKSGKTLAQITADELTEAAERQSVQEKFNAAVEKLQSLFGNLMAGPLGSFLEVLSDGLGIINKMIPALKIIGGIYAIIKGYQLTSNILSTNNLALNRANYAIKATQMGTEAFITREKGVQNLMDKKNLVSRIAYNTLLLAGLISEQGIAGIKTFAATLDEKSLARKIIMGTYDTAAVIAARTKSFFESFSLKSIIGYIAKLPVLLGLKSTEAALATETAAASVVAAEAASFGSATLWIVAGLGAVMGALGTYMAMKDGIIDPKKGPVMVGEFGSVQLDPKDKAMYGADGKIKIGTNLIQPGTPSVINSSIGGLIQPSISSNLPEEYINLLNLSNNSSSIQPSPVKPEINTSIKQSQNTQPSNTPYNNEKNKQVNPPIDLSPVVSALNDVKSAIGKLNNKSWDVYLDSSKLGRGMIKNQTQSV